MIIHKSLRISVCLNPMLYKSSKELSIFWEMNQHLNPSLSVLHSSFTHPLQSPPPEKFLSTQNQIFDNSVPFLNVTILPVGLLKEKTRKRSFYWKILSLNITYHLNPCPNTDSEFSFRYYRFPTKCLTKKRERKKEVLCKTNPQIQYACIPHKGLLIKHGWTQSLLRLRGLRSLIPHWL